MDKLRPVVYDECGSACEGWGGKQQKRAVALYTDRRRNTETGKSLAGRGFKGGGGRQVRDYSESNDVRRVRAGKLTPSPDARFTPLSLLCVCAEADSPRRVGAMSGLKRPRSGAVPCDK
ncbi:hypothetical protein BaRGS_00012430, partial [Batillaria attramentaria]